MAVSAVTESSFDEEVLRADVPVVVDFSAEWCGPCHAIAPSLQQLSEELAGRVAIKVIDVDMNPGIASRYGVRSMPTLIVFRDGEPTAMQVGAAPKSRLADWIRGAIQ